MSDPASIRFNNPGAQYPGPSASRFGSTGHEVIGGGHKIAVFPDATSGAAAQFDLLSRNYSGMTLQDAISKWSGGNSSPAYAAAVARATGLAPDAQLTPELLSNPAVAVPLAKTMAQWEAGTTYPLSDQQWHEAHARATGGDASLAGATPTTPPMGIAPASSQDTPAPQIAASGQKTGPSDELSDLLDKLNPSMLDRLKLADATDELQTPQMPMGLARKPGSGQLMAALAARSPLGIYRS